MLVVNKNISNTSLMLLSLCCSNWWPMFVLFFYVLSPIPTIIAKRLADSYDSPSSACVELCVFVTTGIVISSIGLPIVLAHTEIVSDLF